MICSKRFDKMHVVNRMKWGGWKEGYTRHIEQAVIHSLGLLKTLLRDYYEGFLWDSEKTIVTLENLICTDTSGNGEGHKES